MQLDAALEIARRSLEPFGLDPQARIEFVKYRENHVFRVTDRDRSVALRLHRPGYRDDVEVRSELTYLRALADAGVRVPEVIPTGDGALMLTVRTEAGERRVSAQRWFDDAVPFSDIQTVLAGDHSPDPSEFERIGALLGALHAAAIEIGTPDGFRRGAWDADGLAGEEPLWGDPRALSSLTDDQRAAVDRAMPLLHERLTGLGTDPAVYGVVHADATPENILHTAQGVVLIDFDDFGTGWYVFDLVTAVFHHAGHPRFAEYEDAIRAGYRTARSLSAAELDAWDPLLVARGLTYLGWAAERPGDPASDFISQAVAPWVARAADALTRGEPLPWRTARADSEESR